MISRLSTTTASRIRYKILKIENVDNIDISVTEKHNFWRTETSFFLGTECWSMQLHWVTDLLWTISIFSTERSAFIDVTASIASVKACKYTSIILLLLRRQANSAFHPYGVGK